MTLHAALRYLVVTRWKNRLRAWIGKLRTPTGILGLLVLLLIGGGLLMGGSFGATTPVDEQKAVFSSILAFLLVMGVLSGLGQRGLVFTNADLDFVFPAPFTRPQLLTYHFIPHYIAGAFLALIYLVFMGGRYMPSPLLLYLGILLCQAVNAHLAACAAELSMLVADRLYARVKVLSVALIFGVTVLAVGLLVGGLGGLGNVSGGLRDVWQSGVLRILFYPAVAAAELGAATTPGAALPHVLGLSACVLGSFMLVRWLPGDVLEGSYTATRKVRRRLDQARRGVYTGRVKASSAGPRARWLGGAGAVLWLNVLTLRRQLRAMLGGLLVVIVMLALFAGRSAGSGQSEMMLVMLAMIALWMPLPVGFRLPREQLLALRQLPVRPARLAAALLAVPVLMPLLLQVLALAGLLALGRVDVATALAALPAYLVVGATMVGAESIFVLRRTRPNSVNLVHSLLQILLQFTLLMPGVVTLVAVRVASGQRVAAVISAAVVQSIVALVLILWLGRKLQVGEIAVADA